MRMRLLALFLGLISVVTLNAPRADAQEYPTREITLIVGFPAGGATDVLAHSRRDDVGFARPARAG